MWTYCQSSGKLYKDGVFISVCYSGIGEGLNNPEKQNIKNVGPTPRGVYDIGPEYTHPELGPVTMNLTPKNLTETFGRTDFRIHADEIARAGQHVASHGCIIAIKSVRLQISTDTDKELEVVI